MSLEVETEKEDKLIEREKLKGKCFNKDRIKDLNDKWQQYNMQWDNQKANIPNELYEIIEEIINRVVYNIPIQFNNEIIKNIRKRE
mgnify:CR=1 FL=1